VEGAPNSIQECTPITEIDQSRACIALAYLNVVMSVPPQSQNCHFGMGSENNGNKASENKLISVKLDFCTVLYRPAKVDFQALVPSDLGRSENYTYATIDPQARVAVPTKGKPCLSPLPHSSLPKVVLTELDSCASARRTTWRTKSPPGFLITEANSVYKSSGYDLPTALMMLGAMGRNCAARSSDNSVSVSVR
jgi:hypothetical protein